MSEGQGKKKPEKNKYVENERKNNKMKTKILSATMSAVMLLTAFTGTAAAAARTPQESTHVHTTTEYDEDFCPEYDYTGTTQAPVAKEDTGDFVIIKSPLLNIINTFNDLLHRFIDFLKSLFARDEIPQSSNNPIYATDFSQTNLANDQNAHALCAEFNNLMLGFKNLESDVTITKDVVVDMAVTDMRLPAATENIINEMIDHYLVDESTTESFVKGDCAGLVQSIELFPGGLYNAEKVSLDDDTILYRFDFIEEGAYFDGATTTGIYKDKDEMKPYTLYNDYAADTLCLECFDFGPCRINFAYLRYPSTTIIAATNTQGRIEELCVEMYVQGTGNVNISVVNGSLSLEGYRGEYYSIEYK